MLPQSLFSSYGQYKTDTDFVATWLLSTATRCGYVVADTVSKKAVPAAPPRLKGKARKLARERNRNEDSEKVPVDAVKVKELLWLAEYIARSAKSKVRVPLAFTRRIVRAIELRKLHRSWHEDDDDGGHGYFIHILEKVHETLRSRVVCTNGSRTADVSGRDENHISLTNAFDGLVVQELVVDDDAHAVQDIPSSTCTVDVTGDTNAGKHEEVFAHFCLLMDMHNIRMHLQGLWGSYSKGDEDLATVAITTNTAVDFVRDLQKDFEAAFPHQALIEEEPTCPTCLRALRASTTTHTADMCLVSAHRTLSAYIKNILTVYNTSRDIPNAAPGVELIVPVADRESMTSEAKAMQDFKLIMSIVSELQLLAMSFPTGVQAEHEMLSGLRQLMRQKRPMLWVTFAFQVYLDIRNLHGAAAALAYDDLIDGAQVISQSIQETLTFHEAARIGDDYALHDQSLKKVLDLIELWTVNDVVADTRRAQLRDAHHESCLPKHYLLKRDPLWCGLLLYNFRMIAYEGAIIVANTWMSILPMAHLYNRLQQSHLLTSRWVEMDSLVHSQGINNIFVGDLPCSAQDCAKRLALAMGFPSNAFARNRRTVAVRGCPANARKLKRRSPVHWSFKHRYCDGSGQVDFTPSEVEKIVAQSTAVSAPAENNDIRQPLHRLTLALHAEVPELTFEYFGLHTTCWNLMRRLEAELGPRVFGWCNDTHDEIDLPSFVGHLMTEPSVLCPPRGLEIDLLKDAAKIVGTRS